MTTPIGHLARVALMAALGATLGCFIAISALADGTLPERLVTTGAILLAYGFLGAALGVRASGWYGLGLALPGLAALACFGATGEGRWWYAPYGALIALLAAGAARSVAQASWITVAPLRTIVASIGQGGCPVTPNAAGRPVEPQR